MEGTASADTRNLHPTACPAHLSRKGKIRPLGHYRLADPEQAGILAGELTDHLNNLIAKTDLQVIQEARSSRFDIPASTKAVLPNAGLQETSTILFLPSATMLRTKIYFASCPDLR